MADFGSNFVFPRQALHSCSADCILYENLQISSHCVMINQSAGYYTENV